MKKILTVIVAFCAALCVLAVSGFILTEQKKTDKNDFVCILTYPETFDSIEDFIASSPSELTGENKVSTETVKKLLQITVDGYTLQNVRYRESVYVAATYVLNGYEEIDSFESYENERNSTAIYEVSFFEDPEESLRLNYIEKEEYEPVEHNGKTYYYSAEYTSNGDLMGHAFGFIADDELMYVHLPGSYTLDEALKLLY